MAIYDNADLWYPMPHHFIADGGDGEPIKFNQDSEADLMSKYKPSELFGDFTEREWRLYSVIQARCNGSKKGHSTVIGNKFLEHFAQLDGKTLRLTRDKLESYRRVIKTEQLPNGRSHRYWVIGRKGQTFTGAPQGEAIRTLHPSQSRKAGYKRKTEENDNWGIN
jgi:hypothetical protein